MTSTSDRLAYALATWFGVGRLPVAPGTLGAAASLPLHYLLTFLPWPVHAAAAVALTAVAIWSANRVALALGDQDPQIVVIDEAVGTLLACVLAGRSSWIAVVAAFALFRLLDIWKPWPIHLVESWQPPGVGVVADDVAAGVLAGLIVHLAMRFV